MKTPVTVSDPFEARKDPALPTLVSALDPVSAQKELKRRLPLLSGAKGKLRLKAIRVTRHKPGRRCVVEYEVRVVQPEGRQNKLTLIGKIRARRSGNQGYRLLKKIWDAGFDADSSDRISVPQPIGVLSPFKMWFQRKMPGELASRVLPGPEGSSLAGRIAEAIHKLHQARIPTARIHRMEDELRILDRCLEEAASMAPLWAARLVRINAACRSLGQTLPIPLACGIHRDFYPAQVLIYKRRIILLDFDLYCLGDPALDIGNFIGHMQEQGLREFQDFRALDQPARALRERFLQLSGESRRAAVETYTTLTLARHIYLSMNFSERRPFTERLIEICEDKLGLPLPAVR